MQINILCCFSKMKWFLQTMLILSKRKWLKRRNGLKIFQMATSIRIFEPFPMNHTESVLIPILATSAKVGCCYSPSFLFSILINLIHLTFK
uniref:Uncharacterized protein n=1 Tax=Daphnia magna TaxID=35525 RepID=A0A0P5TR54_9CRUS